jgi:CRISPR-associated protein Cmr3
MSSAKQMRMGLSLEPLDTLFFRDGRPFEAATQAASGLPQPQTVAGALRTWLLRKAGCDFERLAGAVRAGKSFAEAVAEGQPVQASAVGQVRFRGPWFAIDGKLVVPLPCILHRVEETGEVVRLAPLRDVSLPGWVPPEEGMLPLWAEEGRRTKRLDGYLRLDGLHKFLNGTVPDRNEILEPGELFERDRRTGIVVHPESLAADEGMIYAISLLALSPEVSLYAEVVGPEEIVDLFPAGATPLALGGEGRYVTLRRGKPVEWPSARPTDGQGALLLLTSPAFFAEGWRPPNLALTGAAVPGYVAVSGWDLARGGPKPNRFAAEAGSVYFLNRPVPDSLDSLCEGEDAALGWGTFLQGVWR